MTDHSRLSAAQTYFAFRRPRSTPVGQCEKVGCDAKTLKVYPLIRKMCARHVIQFLDPVFRGCGCGPEPCEHCARHIGFGREVIVIGERENGPRHPIDDAKMAAALRATKIDAELGLPPGSAFRQFQRHRRAFSWGASRQRLISVGLRWNVATNLLAASPKCGDWDGKAAREVALALVPHLPADACLVLLGRSVQKAFAGLLEESRITCLPHPSGRNQSLQEGAPVERCKDSINVLYASRAGLQPSLFPG